MLRWNLDPAAQMVHIIAPEDLSMQIGPEVTTLITHLYHNEGYDVQLIPDVANHEDERVTWYATSSRSDVGDLLSAVFAMQTLADPRWKDLACRVIPAGERYTLAQPTTQRARWVRQTSGHNQFADLTATFTPLPETHAIVLDAQPSADLVDPLQNRPHLFEQWLTPSECNYYEKVMFEMLKQWAVVGIAGIPIINIGVKIDHVLYHEVDSSPHAFAIALRQACQTITAEGLLVSQSNSPNK